LRALIPQRRYILRADQNDWQGQSL
jgi:hypothetical protein